ncbi:hypothetical protein C1637_18085 [Chryseobacterium lactis]|uniref:T9SS C-terminal target domain-containing protein n=1 Tax=Chryseobacterium lactis TaxID=1241981 RepID=A0A3G6RJ46_CHRLC|nr:zinc-dependent metalloprotease family protein [Chryseobacterium lactis]AZA82857.1 T9SS C-terminal target domain-containing protein [Chryseobacterium lactis]AZB03239.1 T9SS C-terminal target domain-containing protein [Chryseobacterium lactis]PNW12475.1 hypothetical protein C1637_18085 [Chryseobacterium lactis]
MKIKLVLLTVFVTLSEMITAQQNLWSRASQKDLKNIREKSIRLSHYELANLNDDGLRKQLLNTPERSEKKSVKGSFIKFPDGKGKIDTYEVFEASTMHPDLQKRFPDIRSYVGSQVNDPATKISFTYDPYFGLNATIQSTTGIRYIDSYSYDNKIYVLYERKEAESQEKFKCSFKDNHDQPLSNQINGNTVGKTINDGLLRKYRLAITSTARYTSYIAQQAGVGSGTDTQKKAAVLSAVNTAVNRINQVYEKELSVTLQLIANTDQLFFIGTDTFVAGDDDQMTNQNVIVTNNIIGLNNYDIGHVFTQWTENQGLASTPSVCTNDKASGVTGSVNPVGDPFVIDYVSHEIGHQFGGNHSFNNVYRSNPESAMEPGSGSTIMGYAGINPPDVQSHSDPYFHAISIKEINTWITSGGNCGVNTTTNNHAPTANAGLDKTIPVNTPFVLTGIGTDADNDAITYNWEQMDKEQRSMPPKPISSEGPMFRSILATSDPSRYFPRLSTIVQGYDPNVIDVTDFRTWEKLPSVERILNFSLLVRDNNPVGGQTGRDDIKLTVSDEAGPFVVTSQNTAGTVWNIGESKTITWNVAGTNLSPVNTANVRILLSTDGGLTFPHVLVASTPNNGTYTFNVPGNLGATSNARIMIKAIDNIFLNVNKTNFIINSTLGTSEVEKVKTGIKIYPNPSKGIFTIETESGKGFSYTIFAIDGKLVTAKKEVTSGKTHEEVNVSHLPTGTYIIQLDKEGQKISRKLLIKK